MAKRKLKKFAELNTFNNILQIPYFELLTKDHHLKGKWNKEVFHNNNPITLELGCGKGDYTLALASLFPTHNFIGIDIKGERLWRGCKTAIEQNINNTFFIRTKIDFIDKIFAPNEINEIWITFPDPYPSKRRSKKRLTSPIFLNKYKNILTPENIVHLKTDNDILYKYTLEILQKQNYPILTHTENLYKYYPDNNILNIKTFYEKMFLEEGKTIKYIKFHIPVK